MGTADRAIDGVLWRVYAQPREDRGWTQLVVPKKFRLDILHGQPFNTGDWVWLYSPVVGRGGSHKLNCPWKRPYTVMKKISDVTYRVQNLQRQKDRQVVHFNRLKPCPKDIRLERPKQLVTQPSCPRNAVPSTQPTPLPSDIELVEEDEEISPTMGLGDTDSNPSQHCGQCGVTHQEEDTHLSAMET